MVFYASLVFVAGLILGSFLNVCIHRIPRDLSVVTPRSFCPECGTQITWRHNIPILSYLLLRGRCAYCGHPIPVRYPVVELVTGFVFLLIAYRYGLTWPALKWALLAALLIVLFFTDLEERLLIDECTLGGSLAGLVLAIFVAVPGVFADVIFPDANPRIQSLFNAVLGAALLALPIWAMGALWSRVRQREALGFGDVKLLAMLGIFLGPENGIFALTIGAVAGAVVGTAIALGTRKSVRSYELPFGSFLCVAAILVVVVRAPSGGVLGVP